MNSLERTNQLRLGGDFDVSQVEKVEVKQKLKKKEVEKSLEHPNAPEGSTHLIAVEKDVFFAIEPQVGMPGGSYKNAYTVKKPLYAESIKSEGKWEYFKIRGITKDKLFGVFHRGKRIGLLEGVVFRTEKSNRIKI